MTPDRTLFWIYCVRAAKAARNRAKKRGIPCTIKAHDIDELLIDQEYACALSSLPLAPPTSKINAFGPSLDRIVPALGYVPGNVRIVNTFINTALADWGEETLYLIAKAIGANLGWRQHDFLEIAKQVEAAQEHYRNQRPPVPRKRNKAKKLPNDFSKL